MNQFLLFQLFNLLDNLETEGLPYAPGIAD